MGHRQDEVQFAPDWPVRCEFQLHRSAHAVRGGEDAESVQGAGSDGARRPRQGHWASVSLYTKKRKEPKTAPGRAGVLGRSPRNAEGGRRRRQRAQPFVTKAPKSARGTAEVHFLMIFMVSHLAKLHFQNRATLKQIVSVVLAAIDREKPFRDLTNHCPQMPSRS